LREAQVALALKTVGGFSVNEIAAAFLAEPPTIAQRVVRAKRTLVEHEVQFELPDPARARDRLPAVLDVLYLMFTEGYAAHAGENLTRAELCGEAIRLGRLLASNPITALPPTHALLALMLLQASRLRAREDEAGELVLLGQQDRALWDRSLIIEGLEHLERSAQGDRITPYHTQAAIASCHAVADGEPDWVYILELYNDLMRLAPSSVVQLNRAIALAHVKGPEAGIVELEKLTMDPALRRYYVLPAALGFLWRQAGHPDEAAEHYRRALELPCNAAEHRFLQQRLQECELAGRETSPARQT
jgi:RNA polymerase sigma-70 factor (ECF subfamily)